MQGDQSGNRDTVAVKPLLHTYEEHQTESIVDIKLQMWYTKCIVRCVSYEESTIVNFDLVFLAMSAVLSMTI